MLNCLLPEHTLGWAVYLLSAPPAAWLLGDATLRSVAQHRCGHVQTACAEPVLSSG
jgi:hypothetical protein